MHLRLTLGILNHFAYARPFSGSFTRTLGLATMHPHVHWSSPMQSSLYGDVYLGETTHAWPQLDMIMRKLGLFEAC